IETMRQGVRAGKSGSDEAGRNPRDSGRNHAKLRSVRLHRNPSITRFGDDCATGPTAGFAFIVADAAERMVGGTASGGDVVASPEASPPARHARIAWASNSSGAAYRLSCGGRSVHAHASDHRRV